MAKDDQEFYERLLKALQAASAENTKREQVQQQRKLEYEAFRARFIAEFESFPINRIELFYAQRPLPRIQPHESDPP